MTSVIPELFATALLGLGLASAAVAGVDTVEVQKIQIVRSVSGVVTDPNGALITGAVVAALGPDGSTVLRSVATDKEGYFSLSQRPHQRVYSLRISKNGFDPMIVHVRTSRWTKRIMKVRLVIAT